jgi:hypothetical protein
VFDVLAWPRYVHVLAGSISLLHHREWHNLHAFWFEQGDASACYNELLGDMCMGQEGIDIVSSHVRPTTVLADCDLQVICKCVLMESKV